MNKRDVLGRYNLPREVRFCRRCTVSNQRPRISFDEEERKKLGQTRMKIIEDYAKNYQGLTDQKADQLILAVLKNDVAQVL